MEEEERGTLVADQRPVYTLWRVDGKSTDGAPRAVWIFQAEGGAITQDAVDAYFRSLEQSISKTDGEFVTFYDFSLGISNFIPYALQLARTATRIRELMAPVRTVVLCTSATMRNAMRLVIQTVGGTRPYVIVDNLDAGWEQSFLPRDGDEQLISDSFEGTPVTEGLDMAAVALLTGSACQNDSPL